MNFTFALEQFELFVLILIRLASFVFAAPFFNMANVPRKVKAGFALCLTVLVYSLFPDMTVEYNGMIDYAIIVVEEMIVGILLGAVTSFCVQIIMFAGKIIDMDIGKVAPQMNMFVVGMQMKILVGFGVLFLLQFQFSWNRQFYIYRNEKDDGFIYRGNVLGGMERQITICI